MKLGKIRRGLMLFMSLSLMTPMVFANDGPTSKIGSVSTHTVATGEMAAEETLVSNKAEDIDYEALEQAKIQRIKEQGTALNISKTMGNIKVTAEYIWADQYTYKLLLAVEHVDQTPFAEEGYISFHFGNDFTSKSEYEKQKFWKKFWDNVPENATIEEEIKALAKVDEAYKPFVNADGTVDEEGYLAFIKGDMEENAEAFISGSASSHFSEYEVADAPAYKKYFLKEGSVNEPIEGDMILSLGEYVENKDIEYTPAMDLVAYLEEHKADVVKTQPLEMEEDEMDYVASLKEENSEHYESYMAYLAKRPKQILAEGGLKLNLVEGMPHYWIDNIGFIDEQLHISLMGDTSDEPYRIELYNKDGEFAEVTYGNGGSETDEAGNSKSTSYEAYKIKDVEDLKQYTMRLVGTVETVKTEESIDFEVKMAPQAAKTFEVNQTVAISETEKPVLKSIDITDLSVALKLDGFKEDMEDDFPITLIMKDGKQVVQQCSDATRIGKGAATIIYHLADTVTEIAKISVGGVEINVN